MNAVMTTARFYLPPSVLYRQVQFQSGPYLSFGLLWAHQQFLSSTSADTNFCHSCTERQQPRCHPWVECMYWQWPCNSTRTVLKWRSVKTCEKVWYELLIDACYDLTPSPDHESLIEVKWLRKFSIHWPDDCWFLQFQYVRPDNTESLHSFVLG